MKALSLSQPWASLVALGYKSIENRSQQHSFKTPFPQRILIHAAKSYDNAAPLWIHQRAKEAGIELPPRIFAPVYPGLIGICEFVDAGTPHDVRSKWPHDALWVMDNAEWCYVVRNARPFETPIPYRGQLGFFEVPDALIADALAAAGAAQ